MATRSASRCCLSGCQLSPEDIEIRHDRVYSSRFLRAWDAWRHARVARSDSGPREAPGVRALETPPLESVATLPEGPTVADIATAEELEAYLAFVEQQLCETVTAAISEIGPVPREVTYFRILYAWYMRLDPRSMLETLTHMLSLLRHVETPMTIVYAEHLSMTLGQFMLGTSSNAQSQTSPE